MQRHPDTGQVQGMRVTQSRDSETPRSNRKNRRLQRAMVAPCCFPSLPETTSHQKGQFTALTMGLSGNCDRADRGLAGTHNKLVITRVEGQREGAK